MNLHYFYEIDLKLSNIRQNVCLLGYVDKKLRRNDRVKYSILSIIDLIHYQRRE